MQKPWYQSQTIISSLVNGLLAFASLFHLNLSDLAPQLSDAVGQLINATLILASVAATIHGRIKAGRAATQALILSQAQIASAAAPAAAPSASASTPSASSAETRKLALPLLLATCLLSAAALAGCAGTTAGAPGSSATPVAVTIESNLPLIRTAASVVTGALLDFAVRDSGHRTRLANQIYSSANALYSLSTGDIPTVAQVQASIQSFGGDGADAQYATYAQGLSALYGSWIKQLDGNGKLAAELLTAIGQGAQDGAKAYVTTTVAAS